MIDAGDVTWAGVSELDPAMPKYAILYKDEPLSFWERIRIAWRYIWTKKFDNSRLIGYFDFGSDGKGYPKQKEKKMIPCQVSLTKQAKSMILEGKLEVLDVESNGKATGKIPIDRIIIEQDNRDRKGHGTRKVYFCQKEIPIYEIEYTPFSGDLIIDDLDMTIDVTLDNEVSRQTTIAEEFDNLVTRGLELIKRMEENK